MPGLSPSRIDQAVSSQGVGLSGRPPMHPLPPRRYLAFPSHEEGLQESQLLELWRNTFLDPLSSANTDTGKILLELSLFLISSF